MAIEYVRDLTHAEFMTAREGVAAIRSTSHKSAMSNILATLVPSSGFPALKDKAVCVAIKECVCKQWYSFQGCLCTHLLVKEHTCHCFHDGLSAADLGAALSAARLWKGHSILLGKNAVVFFPHLLRQAEVGLKPGTSTHCKLAKGNQTRKQPELIDPFHDVRRLEVPFKGSLARRLLGLSASKQRNGAVDHRKLSRRGLLVAGSKAWSVICTLMRFEYVVSITH